MVDTRTVHLHAAKLAHGLGRYDDMWAHMANLATAVCRSHKEINDDEHDLLCVALRNMISQRRAVLSSLADRQAEHSDRKLLAGVEEYRRMLQEDLSKCFESALNVLSDQLLPIARKAKSKVYALKLEGDVYRYWAEESSGDKRREMAEQCQEAYKAAWEVCLRELPPLDPLRLGVAVNFSVFFADIVNCPAAAAAIATTAVRLAEDAMKSSKRGADADVIAVLELLEDNIATWHETEVVASAVA